MLDEADARADRRFHVAAADRGTGKVDAAAARGDRAGDHPSHHVMAGAAQPDEAEDLARAKRETDRADMLGAEVRYDEYRLARWRIERGKQFLDPPSDDVLHQAVGSRFARRP